MQRLAKMWTLFPLAHSVTRFGDSLLMVQILICKWQKWMKGNTSCQSLNQFFVCVDYNTIQWLVFKKRDVYFHELVTNLLIWAAIFSVFALNIISFLANTVLCHRNVWILFLNHRPYHLEFKMPNTSAITRNFNANCSWITNSNHFFDDPFVCDSPIIIDFIKIYL